MGSVLNFLYTTSMLLMRTMYALGWAAGMLPAECEEGGGVNSLQRRVGVESESLGVLVTAGIRAVEVRIPAVSESTMLEVVLNRRGRDAAPFVGHDAHDGVGVDVMMATDGLFPLMEQGVVQRAETLSTICRHEAHLCHVLTPHVMEEFQHLGGVMNGGSVHDQHEWVQVHCAYGLRQNVLDVGMEHSLTYSFNIPTLSILWGEYDWRKHSVSRYARDHVVPWGVRVRVIDHHISVSPWTDKGVLGMNASANMGLVEEQQLPLVEPFELPAHGGDGSTH